MFERFVPSARAVVLDARAHARRLGQPFVGTEHLLLALVVSSTPAGEVLRGSGLGLEAVEQRIRDAIGPPPLESDRAALAALGIDLDQVTASIESTFGPGALAAAAAAGVHGHGRGRRRPWRRRRSCTVPAPGHMPLTPRAKKCLELALRETIRLRQRHITSEHVALGILREGEGVACLVLAAAGLSFDELRAELEAATDCASR